MTGQQSELVWKKFDTEEISKDIIPDSPDAQKLIYVCNELSKYYLLSPYPPDAVYKGKPVKGSNGNVSFKQLSDPGYSIVMTQTQLLSKENLELKDLVDVKKWDPKNNKVSYIGPREPTSEFWLHQKLYEEFPEVTWIVHGHAPKKELYDSQGLWEELGIIETRRKAEDGTLDVPMSVLEVLKNPLKDYIVLKDHYTPWDFPHIGVVVMADNPDSAVEKIEYIQNRLKKPLK